MKRVGVFYATREGQAHRVAVRMDGALIARELEVAVHQVDEPESDAALAMCDATVLVASVHAGQHEQEMVRFVQKHPRVREIPGVFVSVCLTEAIAESAAVPVSERNAAARKVQEQVRFFLDQTHWQPAHVHPVAGALVYTHYNALTRWGMKRLAKHAGLPTDTTHDWELTDWADLEKFAARIAAELHGDAI